MLNKSKLADLGYILGFVYKLKQNFLTKAKLERGVNNVWLDPWFKS